MPSQSEDAWTNGSVLSHISYWLLNAAAGKGAVIFYRLFGTAVTLGLAAVAGVDAFDREFLRPSVRAGALGADPRISNAGCGVTPIRNCDILTGVVVLSLAVSFAQPDNAWLFQGCMQSYSHASINHVLC